jgi:hypothetical protein
MYQFKHKENFTFTIYSFWKKLMECMQSCSTIHGMRTGTEST